MKKIFFLLLLVINVAIAQEIKIDNEAQELFDIYLKNKNLTINEYAKQNDFKSLYVLMNNSKGFSKIDFDKQGNIISYFVNQQTPIRKIENEYDDLNRITKTKYYDEKEQIFKETYNKFSNDSILTYLKETDNLIELKYNSKNCKLDEIYENGEIVISLKQNYDNDGNLILEKLFKEGLTDTKEYEIKGSEKFVTLTKMNSLDSVLSTEKYLIERKVIAENKTYFYKSQTRNPFKVETYDNNKLISELYLDLKGNNYKEIVYKFDEKGILIKIELINYASKKKTKYTFKTNNKGWLTDIMKHKKVSYNFKFLMNK